MNRVRDAPVDVRRALAGTAVLFVANGAASHAWLARLPELQERLGIGLDVVGVVLLVHTLGATLVSPLSGAAVNRLGSRTVAVGGSMLLSCLVALLAVVDGPLQLGVLLFAVGAADATADVAMNAQASIVQDRLPRSVFSRLHGAWSAGGLLGAATAALAAAVGIGFGPFVVAVAAVLTIGAAATARVLVADPARVGAPADAPADAPAGVALRVLVRRGAVLAALGALVVVMEAPARWGALLVTRDRGGSAALGGIALAVFAALQLVGRLAGDAVVDRVGPVRAVRASVLAQVVGLGLVLVALGPWVAVAGHAALGVGAAVAFPLLYRAAARTPGLPGGTGLAVMTFGSGTGALVAPALVGVTAERAGGVAIGLAGVMGVALVAIALAAPRFRTDEHRR